MGFIVNNYCRHFFLFGSISFATLHFLLTRVGYLTWPQRWIADGFERDLNRTGQRLQRTSKRFLCLQRARNEPEWYLLSKLDRIPLWRTLLSGGFIDEETMHRLAANGIQTAADIRNAWSFPGVSRNEFDLIKKGVARLESKVMRRFQPGPAFSMAKNKHMAELTQEKAELEQRWEKLQQERRRFPDSSFAEFIHYLKSW